MPDEDPDIKRTAEKVAAAQARADGIAPAKAESAPPTKPKAARQTSR